MERQKLIVHRPQIYHNKVISTFTPPESISHYFNQTTFWAMYSENIQQVPPSILTIPLLANILPITWVANVDVHVDEIDKNFLEAIAIIKNALQAMYPDLTFSGEIIAEQIVENTGYAGHKCGTLFSGGVDSLTSYIRKRDEQPFLITVLGADISINNKDEWNLVKANVTDFANKNHLPNLFITTNFKKIPAYSTLRKTFSIEWWGHIQHGFGLLGLCSPLSHCLGLETIYIPSTHWPSLSIPWGSHPSIDNHVKWGETSSVHEGYELTRQAKMNVIANYINEVDPSLQIRVCWKYGKASNCGKCEKCAFTMLGLMLEGINPANHGFIKWKSFYKLVRMRIRRKRWRKTAIDQAFWSDIIDSIPRKSSHIKQGRKLFSWLIRYK